MSGCGGTCTCGVGPAVDEAGIWFLAGHPGSGKTTVGPLLAAELGLPFTDLDVWLGEREGRPAAAFIRERGLDAFRSAEARALEALPAAGPRVVALGGGTLEHAASRAIVARRGTVVWLDVPRATLARRLRQGDRPLLDAPAALPRLLDAREGTRLGQLRRFPAGRRPPDQVARDLADSLRPGCISLADAAPHEILVGIGALDRALRLTSRRVALVTSAPVRRRFGPAVEGLLADLGREMHVLEVPDGEPAKDWRVLGRLVSELLALGFGRHDTLVALGGGTVGDVAGLAASLVGRGMPWVVLPTTMLAQVDAAMGGKVAVNHAVGRNMVGAFHQPLAVGIEPAVLAGLPPRAWRSGLAEVIKTLWLAGDGAITRLRALPADPRAWAASQLHEILEACARHKARVVLADPDERRGPRLSLNLGHTVGHALEVAARFRGLTHGEAVAVGLRAACRISEAVGVGNPGIEDRLADTLRHFDLPVTHEQDPDAVVAALPRDKKAVGGRLRWVLPVREGQVAVSTDVPQDLVARVVADLAAAPSRR
ncbi:MAG: bifunctional shikimate kinase/3-dehydroquinate synthase [Candidatus Sericytochromatia bacterium]|nr:bifunctional shikimate kinase/3-dehydroquinate synthase [Candidatus Sericytochromatia bacterium]